MAITQSLAAWAWRVQNVVCPFLLVVLAVLPIYLFGVRFNMSVLALADDDVWPAYGVPYSMPEDARISVSTSVTITVLFVVLWLLWVLPLGYCLWSYHFVARRWKVVPSPEAPTRQVDGKTGKRRFCSKCQIFMGDRTYHSTHMNKCLPHYDHWCYWWAGGIWLHNVKAYVTFIFFAPIYQLFILGTSIWILASPTGYRRDNSYAALGVVSGLALLFSVTVLYTFGGQLVVQNGLCDDYDGVWFISDEGDVRFWDQTSPSRNPWDQGWRKNSRTVLGPWWTWPFFWTTTPLMDATECYRHAEIAIPLRPLEVTSRRGNGVSTGFEEDDIELGTLTRRSTSSF